MDKKKIRKNVFVIALIILLVALAYFIYPLVKLLYSEEGRIILSEKINSYGIFAPLVFILTEVIQIVLAFIPGAPVDIMGGALFGCLWGSIYCFIGIFTGSMLVFFLVRIFGKPLVEKIFPKQKFENIRLLNNPKRLSAIIFILFFIPGTPKDFLTYIAGLTDISPLKFMLIVSVARFPAMMCSVVMGDSFFDGNFTTAFVIMAVIIILSVIGYFIKKKFLNNERK